MPLSVTCPACGVKLRAPESLTQKTVHCPKCGASVTLASSAETEPHAAVSEPAAFEVAVPPPEPPKPKPRRFRDDVEESRPEPEAAKKPRRITTDGDATRTDLPGLISLACGLLSAV